MVRKAVQKRAGFDLSKNKPAAAWAELCACPCLLAAGLADDSVGPHHSRSIAARYGSRVAAARKKCGLPPPPGYGGPNGGKGVPPPPRVLRFEGGHEGLRPQSMLRQGARYMSAQLHRAAGAGGGAEGGAGGSSSGGGGGGGGGSGGGGGGGGGGGDPQLRLRVPSGGSSSSGGGGGSGPDGSCSSSSSSSPGGGAAPSPTMRRVMQASAKVERNSSSPRLPWAARASDMALFPSPCPSPGRSPPRSRASSPRHSLVGVGVTAAAAAAAPASDEVATAAGVMVAAAATTEVAAMLAEASGGGGGGGGGGSGTRFLSAVAYSPEGGAGGGGGDYFADDGAGSAAGGGGDYEGSYYDYDEGSFDQADYLYGGAAAELGLPYGGNGYGGGGLAGERGEEAVAADRIVGVSIVGTRTVPESLDNPGKFTEYFIRVQCVPMAEEGEEEEQVEEEEEEKEEEGAGAGGGDGVEGDDSALQEAVAQALAEEGLGDSAEGDGGSTKAAAAAAAAASASAGAGGGGGDDPRCITYTVTRRFRQFQRLHADLKLMDPALARALPAMPEGGLRAFADRFSPKRIAQRAKAFDATLQLVCACYPDIMQSRYVRRFLKQNSMV